MTPKEAQELAQLLGKMPGIRTVELKDVRKLAELLHEFPELGSIEVKGLFDTGVVMTRTGQSSVPAAPMMMAPAMSAPAAGPPPPTPSAPAPAAASVLKEIKSPMVGTFYKSPEPGAQAYVKVGSRVTSGAAVCIIEAMKIMNEIESEVTGVVREVCVEESQPVEFGTVLFRVDPNG